MTDTDVPMTRDKERTRAAILEAAVELLSRRGSKVSFADVASAAGVTSGGLRHHFPDRRALVRAVVKHCLEKGWAEIHRCVDLSENRPGKFARGYVRALTDDLSPLSAVMDPARLTAALGTDVDCDDMWAEDAERTRQAMVADGLPRDRALVIQYAAEGLAVARNTPYLSEDALVRARAELLAMTEQPWDT